MAAGVLAKPGAEYGPCMKRCKHLDCKETRREAASACRFCAKAIGFDSAFFRSRLSGDLAHRHCLEDAVERNDARVGLF